MKIAVVGSGTAGLAAAWALNSHSEHEVTLLEADERWGGHANTVDFKKARSPSAQTTRVDTGFIVFNTVTYPNFLAFLQHMRIPYGASDMSFSVSRDRGLFEWAGGSLGQLFAQRINLLNPGQWRMVWDILRFNNGALELLRKGDEKESIGSYLAREGYSQSFVDNYLLPMTAAIWSTPPDKAALDFPAFTLIRFMHNHHLLQILDRPTWLTVKEGSHSYVNRIIDSLPGEHCFRNSRIQSASSKDDGKVELVTEMGEAFEFDHVVFACHADTTLKILERGEGITEQERKVLGGFEFSKNRAVLHSDPALMPQRRATWSAWNYLTASDGPKANVNTVSLTYWMNLLQSIPETDFGPVLVTLNPPFEPKAELVAKEYWYEHPLFSESSVKSQGLLPTIQNKRGFTFAGAWTKYGFHEDGFASGLRVANDYLSATLPFPLRHAERSLTSTPTDQLVSVFLAVGEAGRRILERPFTWLLLVLVLGLALLDATLGAVGGILAASDQPERRKQAEMAQDGLREVRALWEKSAGRKQSPKLKPKKE